MIARFDYFNKFENPILSLCNPNHKVIGILDGYIKNLKLTFVFNEIWELTLDVYKHKGKQELPCFDLIQSKRKILVEEVGYFIIDKITKNTGDDGTYLSISALSCEISIRNKKLNYFEGTYKFFDSSDKNKALMNEIMKYLPRWSLGHVDSSIANKYRTFDKPDNTVYGFLINDVQKAYECIFEFDILNYVINVYDKLNYINKTSILLTKDETIENIKKNDEGSQIITALNVLGQNDLNIRSVNPLGLNTIYNFDYYKTSGMMSNNLVSAINAWEAKIQSSEAEFQSILLSLKNQNAILQTLNQELEQLQIDLDNYYAQQTEVIKSGKNSQLLTVANYINSTISAINNKKSQINSQQIIINNLVNTRNVIYENNSFENNFTEEQYDELSDFITEDTYNDEYITITDSMTYEEIQNQALELYNKAKNLLLEISQPSYEYEIDTNDFVFNKKFLKYTEQLKVGSLINAEIEEDNIVELILLKMEIDYENKTIDLGFGNRYSQNNPYSLFIDRYDNLTESANTVNFERNTWNKPVKSGALDRFTTFVNSPINLNNNAIVDVNGNALLSNYGYTGKTDDGKEIRIIDNQVYISKDGFMSDSKKLIDDKGVLSSFVFSMKVSGIGVGLESGGDVTGFIYVNQGFDIYIPDNFTITKSVLKIMVFPQYYQNIEGYSGWGYPRNIKCYLTTDPTKMAGHTFAYSMSDFVYNVQNNGAFIDKTLSFFGVSSITPYVNESWNFNSNSTTFASVYTSNDLSSIIPKGNSSIGFGITSLPAYNEASAPLIIAQYSGHISATLSIEGYAVI